jgi:hypothetical protein
VSSKSVPTLRKAKARAAGRSRLLHRGESAESSGGGGSSSDPRSSQGGDRFRWVSRFGSRSSPGCVPLGGTAPLLWHREDDRHGAIGTLSLPVDENPPRVPTARGRTDTGWNTIASEGDWSSRPLAHQRTRLAGDRRCQGRTRGKAPARAWSRRFPGSGSISMRRRAPASVGRAALA